MSVGPFNTVTMSIAAPFNQNIIVSLHLCFGSFAILNRDLQLFQIIKGMVQEDERKMDALTRRATELTMVNNNSK